MRLTKQRNVGWSLGNASEFWVGAPCWQVLNVPERYGLPQHSSAPRSVWGKQHSPVSQVHQQALWLPFSI